MTESILTQHEQITKSAASDPILHIRLFDKKGQWQLEVVFIGGAKETGPMAQDEVTALESDLQHQGWQVDASLFCGGFNAKPAIPAAWYTVNNSVDDFSVDRKTGKVTV